ncbi:hypothetical protein [Nostoc sp. ChiSLP03a]|uniref:hypothetical protein n=1 Tax=Nostoc sp. ChiSLP03a TaxID=3075380 RepID=UPI002AD35A71|nr:hypothetical protein [Nostoc sp. ChiSLP03a]MDZ7964826.1 hypothetical protein [Nostoc sp. DedSLP03]
MAHLLPTASQSRLVGLSNEVAFSSKLYAGSLESIKKIQVKLEKRIRVSLHTPVGQEQY